MFYLRTFLMGLWIFICLIIALVKMPFLWRNPRLGGDFGHMFAAGAQKITNVSVEVFGMEYLEASQPCIYTGNHQSNFDLVTIGQIFPGKTVVIGKKELFWIPLFGILYWASGHILIDRQKTDKAKNSFAQVVEEIKNRKVSVMVFPEGTRNFAGVGLLPFKKGAFHMAIDAQVPIVPFVSSPLFPVADFKQRKIPGGKVQIKILPPISTEGLTEADVSELSDLVRKKMEAALLEIHTEGRE